MRNSVRRYSTSALKSARKRANSYVQAEGTAEQKMDRLRKEIETLEAQNTPAHVIRLKKNNLALVESRFKQVRRQRVKAELKFQSYLDKNDSLDRIS